MGHSPSSASQAFPRLLWRR